MKDELFLQNRQRVERVVKLLEALKRGDCWCETAIGNPMQRGHSKSCKEAVEVMKGLSMELAR